MLLLNLTVLSFVKTFLR